MENITAVHTIVTTTAHTAMVGDAVFGVALVFTAIVGIVYGHVWATATDFGTKTPATSPRRAYLLCAAGTAVGVAAIVTGLFFELN